MAERDDEEKEKAREWDGGLLIFCCLGPEESSRKGEREGEGEVER